MANVVQIPDPPVLQPIADDKGYTKHQWQSWFFLLRQALQSAITAASAQIAIQFKDEGTNLGTPGTVDTINIVGPNLIVTRSVNTLTIRERAASRAYAARH